MHISPDVWGPFFWSTMHIVALGYPTKPNYSDKRSAKEFFEALTRLIPCAICREHYTAHIKELPISSSLDSRQDLFRWTITLHNKVNKMLNKPEKTEVEVIKYYELLGARGRSPIWNHDDLSEMNMRSYINGLAVGAAAVAVLGGFFYYYKE